MYCTTSPVLSVFYLRVYQRQQYSSGLVYYSVVKLRGNAGERRNIQSSLDRQTDGQTNGQDEAYRTAR